MFLRKLCGSLMAASLVAVPVQRAQADEAAALLGGMLLGGIIVNEANKNKQRRAATRATTTTTRTTTTRRSSPGISSAQREENRQVQTALNYFGYNVGSVDGVLGRRSRAGISRYQAEMGYQPDGYLDGYERDFLLGSYHRALASGTVPPYNQVLASQGPGGLLRTYRNEQLGIASPSVQPAATPQPTQLESMPTRSSEAALPEFTFGQVARSVNDHCNQVNVLTAANGGFTTAGQVTDPQFALNEQFCLARTHAMTESNAIVATIPDLTDAQIESQCSGLAQVMAPQIGKLGTARPDMVIAEASSVLQDSGQPLDQLVAAGRVCLGVGYRTDDPKVALASAVLLSSASQLGYGEIVSHHMREGIGTVQTTPQQSAAWMKLALDAVDKGAPAVLGQSPGRIAVLRDASSGAASNNATALPVFQAPAKN